MATVKSVLKAETFFLDYADHRDVIGSQWGFSYKCWFIYRSITLLYLLVLLIVGFTNKFMRYQWKFFTMLTHWAFLIFVFSYLFKWICLIKYRKWFHHGLKVKGTPDEEKPLLLRQQSWITNHEKKNHTLVAFSWLLANIAHVFAINVTIGYWYDGAVPSFANLPDALNFQMHGVNAAMTVVDLLLVAQPTFLAHFYQPVLYLACYYSFTAFYYVAGGTSKLGTRGLYPNLNWEKPQATLIDLGEESLKLVAIHVAMWLVASIRIIIARRCTNKRQL